jgi:hypothetical protein
MGAKRTWAMAVLLVSGCSHLSRHPINANYDSGVHTAPGETVEVEVVAEGVLWLASQITAVDVASRELGIPKERVFADSSRPEWGSTIKIKEGKPNPHVDRQVVSFRIPAGASFRGVVKVPLTVHYEAAERSGDRGFQNVTGSASIAVPLDVVEPGALGGVRFAAAAGVVGWATVWTVGLLLVAGALYGAARLARKEGNWVGGPLAIAFLLVAGFSFAKPMGPILGWSSAWAYGLLIVLWLAAYAGVVSLIGGAVWLAARRRSTTGRGA